MLPSTYILLNKLFIKIINFHFLTLFNKGGNQMTVGKIYCAKLIYENYKHVKRSGRKNKLVSMTENLFTDFNKGS